MLIIIFTLFLFRTTPAPPVQTPTLTSPTFSLPIPSNGISALIPAILGVVVVAVFLLMLISCFQFTLIIINVALLWGKYHMQCGYV